jgi:hypothetical protein
MPKSSRCHAEVTWARSVCGLDVFGIVEMASLQAKAAATDAPIKLIA